MPGGDLAQKMKSGGLTKIHSIETALSIAKALAYLHGTKPYPVVHRDMKPENIFFDQRGVAKLADMGLARILPGKSGRRYQMTGKTGTMRYMAPEVCRGDPYDETVDIYGLGLIFYYMISREMPFKGYSRERRIEFAEARIPYSVPPSFRMDDDCKTFIQGCTQPHGHARPSSLECVAELEEVKQNASRSRCSVM
mmetsp:Transcript_22202/g.43193  ORF Transcript_22202/g.43193 Transcript_22202/m.43193 type:complete len:195 (+) Transcript_22202:1-585(+)